MIKKLLVSPLGWLIGILLSLGICIGALFLGSLDTHSLLNSEIGHNILWNIRLPRVLLAFVIGASLSLAGVMIQSNVRNPLADPSLIGVSAGAALGAALMIVAADFVDIQAHYYIVQI